MRRDRIIRRSLKRDFFIYFPGREKDESFVILNSFSGRKIMK